jgi:hypothetical protein
VLAFLDSVRVEDTPPQPPMQPEGPSHVRLIAREVYTTHRALLVPWAALVALAVAGGTVRHSHLPMLEVILAVPGLAVVGYVATRTATLKTWNSWPSCAAVHAAPPRSCRPSSSYTASKPTATQDEKA